jgi:hypothetical protein
MRRSSPWPPLLFATGCVAVTLAGSGACSITDEENAAPPGSGSGEGSATTTGGLGGSGAGKESTVSSTSAGGAGAFSGGGDGGQWSPGLDGVSCGVEVCTNGDVCCIVDGTTSCTTYSACVTELSGATAGAGDALVSCDESSDCGMGDRCCAGALGVATEYACSAGPCDFSEVCSPGGDCKDVSHECVSDPDGATGAKCVEPSVTVLCDGATCDATTPVCCPGTGCIAYGASCIAAFECDGPEDCGGALCCQSGGGAECRGPCLPTNVVCKDIADCPPDSGVDAKGCEGAGGLGTPAELKSCAY